MTNLFTRKAMAFLSVGFLTFATLAPAMSNDADEEMMADETEAAEMFDADANFHPPYPPSRPHYRVVCYARNARGMSFHAQGRDSYRVQQRAMEKCSEQSRYCQPVGCSRLY